LNFLGLLAQEPWTILITEAVLFKINEAGPG